MRQEYRTSYRRSGVTSISELKNPTIMEYPFIVSKGSVLHYFDFNDKQLGPDKNDPFIASNLTDGLFINNVYKLRSDILRPRYVGGSIVSKLRKFNRTLDGVKLLTGRIESVIGTKAVMNNYVPLNTTYKKYRLISNNVLTTKTT